MNRSIISEIQSYLERLGSIISIKEWENIYDPGLGISVYKGRRSISIHTFKQQFGASLCTNQYCYARYLTSDLFKMAKLIDLWLGKRVAVNKLSTFYPDIELFKSIKLHSDTDNTALNKAWDLQKNFFFRDEYHAEVLHFDMCIEVLERAKENPLLSKLYPYSSLGSVCFSDNKQRISPDYLCIAPNSYSSYDGKYFVVVPPDKRVIQVETLDEGLKIIIDHLDLIKTDNSLEQAT